MTNMVSERPIIKDGVCVCVCPRWKFFMVDVPGRCSPWSTAAWPLTWLQQLWWSLLPADWLCFTLFACWFSMGGKPKTTSTMVVASKATRHQVSHDWTITIGGSPTADDLPASPLVLRRTWFEAAVAPMRGDVNHCWSWTIVKVDEHSWWSTINWWSN